MKKYQTIRKVKIIYGARDNQTNELAHLNFLRLICEDKYFAVEEYVTADFTRKYS
jgi:hypothetical protein